MISNNDAGLIATFIQAILYGIYLITFAFCLRWFMYEDEGWTFRKTIMLSITNIVFLFSTIDLGTSVWMTINSYSPDDNLQLVVHRLNVANVTIELGSILILDAVLIYRCFKIYDNSWLFISPLLVLWTGDLVCAVLDTAGVALRDLHLKHGHVWKARLPLIAAVFYSCNIAITMYATGAIISRIFGVAKRSPSGTERLHNTCRILAESGGLYALSSALELVARVLYRPRDPQFFVFATIAGAINFSMAGITFNLVQIRVRKSRVEPNDSHTDTSFTKEKKPISALQFHGVATNTKMSDFGYNSRCDSREENEP